MGIGLGIVLLVIGLILVLGVVPAFSFAGLDETFENPPARPGRHDDGEHG